ncbi:hypothetical protein FGO68_gene17446 [Halteria grandinella]|uniref:Uncharacterized protein n=1 Tax=Halteria grandinella TaxID=5974 RepID=A0A8J8SVP5_HALGN|nr:hypothetical protein FGO68_gene17446 [Halteria grandinella]
MNQINEDHIQLSDTKAKDTEALLQPSGSPTKQTASSTQNILWGQSLLAALAWGSANFFYSILTTHDFSVICLSWTGFIGTAIVYKVVKLARDPRKVNRNLLKEALVAELGSKDNLLHQFTRTGQSQENMQGWPAQTQGLFTHV